MTCGGSFFPLGSAAYVQSSGPLPFFRCLGSAHGYQSGIVARCAAIGRAKNDSLDDVRSGCDFAGRKGVLA